MGWSGGTFSRVHDWTTDEGSAIDIEADRMDAEDDNFASGINACIHKGGTNTPTTNLPMGGYRHTGVGDSTAKDQYSSTGDIIDQGLVYYTDTGSANAYAITPSPSIVAYAAGQRLVFKAVNANTGASTLNVNALGTKDIVTADGDDVVANMIAAGGVYEVTYNGTKFVMTSPDSLGRVYESRQVIAGTALSGGGTLDNDVTLNLSHLGIQSLSDPGADRMLFWDDGAGATGWLVPNTGLSISGTNLNAEVTQAELDAVEAQIEPTVTKVKSAPTTRDTEALSADPHLTGWTLVTGKRYEVTGTIMTSTGGTADTAMEFKLVFSQTPSDSGQWGYTYVNTNNDISGDAVACGNSLTCAEALTNRNGIWRFRAIFLANTGSGGTLSFHWREGAAGAQTLTLGEGSCITVRQIT